MFFKEDNTYNEMRESSMKQWLGELLEGDDKVNKYGAKLTLEYLDYLDKKMKELEKQNALRDEFLKRMKNKLNDAK